MIKWSHPAWQGLIPYLLVIISLIATGTAQPVINLYKVLKLSWFNCPYLKSLEWETDCITCPGTKQVYPRIFCKWLYKHLLEPQLNCYIHIFIYFTYYVLNKDQYKCYCEEFKMDFSAEHVAPVFHTTASHVPLPVLARTTTSSETGPCNLRKSFQIYC